MMKEMIKKSLGFWNNYWGDSVFPYLLAIALLYLLIFKRKKKTGIVSVLFSLYGQNHTEMHWRKCLLADFVACTVYTGDRPGNDRVYPGKKGSFAAGSSGALYSSGRSWGQRVLYRRILS